ARSLVESQFPDLAPARLTSFGVGWDNTAYLVNDEWVFRFPRREIAVDLIETENRLLPALADRLPLPIPVPTLTGEPEERYPWPFAGYRELPGHTACRADLDDKQRALSAAPLAEFLKTLHAVPAAEAHALGAPPDTIRRMDVAYRTEKVRDRLDQCVACGLVDDPAPFRAILDDTPRDWTPAADTLVHGDLYARHVLVDDDGHPTGVIDWGDVHVGDRANDLGIVAGFLPPSAQATFFEVYGAVDDDTWRMARFRALLSAVMILVYGHDVDDDALVREGLASLRFLVSP
ncbi:MAG: phosphotransferase, partial [Planctomycetota bacterium]